jgi:beta-N-acetylhexosaminidase
MQSRLNNQFSEYVDRIQQVVSSTMLVFILFILLLNPLQTRAQMPQIDVRWYEEVMKTMTLDEKLGQLFMVAAYSNKGVEHTKEIEKMIEKHHLGGLIFFQGDPLKQAYLTNYFQSLSKVPLFIGQDAEWGLAMRIQPTVKYPYQLTMGALQDDQLIFEMGRQLGKQCKALGVHINFAPVADVNVNPNNPIINFRSFGENPKAVARKALYYAMGMQEEQVLACAKHFPGHGDTDADSHKELPVILHNRARLDSVELYPFRYLSENGVASVMSGHLFVPALDNRTNRPSSLSKSVITDLLKKEYGFRGLVITDAMNMKGVRNHFLAGDGELEAFLAGNHILLFPGNVEISINRIKKALADGLVSMEEIDTRVREILRWKDWAGLAYYKPIDTENLKAALFPPQADTLNYKIAQKSITLLQDKSGILPVSSSASPVFVIMGKSMPDDFVKQLKQAFDNPEIIYIPRGSAAASYQTYLNKIKSKKNVFITVHNPSIWSPRSFNKDAGEYQYFGIPQREINFILQAQENAAVCPIFFCNPYILKQFGKMNSGIMAYEDEIWFHQAVIEVIKGAIPAEGKLPVSAGIFPYGTGGLSMKTEMKEVKPPVQDVPVMKQGGLNTNKFKEIDRIAQSVVDDRAAPGCRVLVLKNGEAVYDKSFGYHTYERKERVKPNDLYDLASITKVAATTLAIMKLYEDKKILLDDKLSKHLAWLRNSNKENITIRQVLMHESGLPAWVPFYKESMVDYDNVYSHYEDSLKCLEIAQDMFILPEYRFQIYEKIRSLPLNAKKYVYSDLGMIILKELVEQVSKEPFDYYLTETFYKPMGLQNMTFNPLTCMDKSCIIPTQNDQLFRKQLVHGYVHDPGAAMLGGISGHAGLFASAYDLAAIGQMLLNNGTYNGHRFFDLATIVYFTSKQHYHNRRGLGWDKPELTGKISPASQKASPKCFGHTGFTGTAFWVDPEHQLVYVFLSNRIYPDEENRKLISGNYRTRIMDVIYEAMGK